jgi:hypothetical protein
VYPAAAQLEACQRRFFKSFDMAATPASNGGVLAGAPILQHVLAGAVGITSGFVPFPTRMRAYPGITTYNPAAAGAQAWTFGVGNCAATGAVSHETGVEIYATAPGGAGANARSYCHYTANAQI